VLAIPTFREKQSPAQRMMLRITWGEDNSCARLTPLDIPTKQCAERHLPRCQQASLSERCRQERMERHEHSRTIAVCPSSRRSSHSEGCRQ
jgi:hypothetical protein